MSFLLLIGGPPGAGKTTVAARLAETAERPTVHLNTDSFYVSIKAGFVLPYLPAARRQNEVVSKAIAEAAAAYARGGYDVIVEGILGPWNLAPFRAAAARDGLALAYAVLQPSLEVTLARAAARQGRVLSDVEPITGLHRAFAALGELASHAIDTSGHSVDETVSAVRDALAANRLVLRREHS